MLAHPQHSENSPPVRSKMPASTSVSTSLKLRPPHLPHLRSPRTGTAIESAPHFSHIRHSTLSPSNAPPLTEAAAAPM